MSHEIKMPTRAQFLSIIVFIVTAIFIGRLFYLQVIRHQYYVEQANAEQLKSRIVPAKRGEIYAMSGNEVVPFVKNQVLYTVFADPETVDKPQKVVEAVREIAGGDAQPHLEELVQKEKSRYQILAKKVTRRQAEALKKLHLRGVGFQEVSQRVYIEGASAAQILGFVNNDNVGNYGIEGALNDELRGKDGKLQTVTDVRDVPLTIGSQNVVTSAEDGKNVVLTIDRQVQAYAEKALKKGLDKIHAPDGSMVVMDPATGHVLAMANYPSYNPSKFGEVNDAARYNNKIISDPYEPASVIKTFTMATGIDKGAVSPNSSYMNTDSTRVGDITVHNALRGMTGQRTMQEVLNYSLNTGTVEVARRLGDGNHITAKARQTLYTYFHDKFRLGQKTGISLANESPGLIVSPKEQEGNAVRYSNMTFGQGLNVTMLQVLAAFSATVNGGVYYTPQIVAGAMKEGDFIKEAEAPSQRIIKEQTSQDVRRMLRAARRSVAWMRDADTRGYMIGGKTGTAETLRNGRYVKSETVGTYLGYGGTQDNPDYVIMVRVAAPGRNLEGGIHAEPIFADMSNWMIHYLELPPKGE